MKKSLYILLFIGLSVIISGMVAWSAELAYLSILEADSLIGGIPDGLGYVYNSNDPFDYVYIIFVALGVIVGAVQGVRMWERLYGDQMIIVRHRINTQILVLYAILTLLVCALAYTTNTFGIRSFFEKEKVASLSLINQYEEGNSFSSVSGVTLLTVSCEEAEKRQEGRVSDCVRPYSALFGVFQDNTIVKTVESTENGVFKVSLPPGRYILQPLPVTDQHVLFSPIDFSLAEGEGKQFEILFRSI